MPKILKAQLPPPDDQNDFDDLCENISKEYWQDPMTEKYGIQGHRQYGIDIVCPLAKEGHNTLVIGIQCKKKKRLTGRKLSKKDVNESLKKAEEFTPPLSRLIVATTSSKDIKIQTHVNGINVSRGTNNKFPVKIWFWEDIERILRENCPKTYLQYLITIFPAGSTALISKDLIKEALHVAENLVQDNYTERTKGVLSILGKRITELNDPEIEAIADRIRARLLIREEKADEAMNLLLELTEKNKSDIYSWEMLFDRYIENGDLNGAKIALENLKNIDAGHPLTRNVDLAYKLHTHQDFEYPLDELTGTGRDKAKGYTFYHLYANGKKDREKRDYYLEKQRVSNPRAPSPVYFDIIYKVWDLFEDLEGTPLEEIQTVSTFILAKENELKTKNPILLSQDLGITFEKLRIDVLLLRQFKPMSEVTLSLREDTISKICRSYFSQYIYLKLLHLLALMPLTKEELSKLIEYIGISRKEIKSDLAYLLLAQTLLNDPTFEYAESVCTKLSLIQEKEFLDALKEKNSMILCSKLKNVHEDLLHPLLAAIPDPQLTLDVINSLDREYGEETKASLTRLKIFCITQQKGKKSLEEIRKEIQFEKLGFYLLNEVAAHAEASKLWDLQAECLRNMLKFALTDKDKVYLETRLALSLFYLEDYSGVMEKKDSILQHLNKLQADNQKVAIKLFVSSAIKIHQLSAALGILKSTFEAVSNEFEMYYCKAEIEVKQEKHEDALSTILEGFRSQAVVSREMYQACYIILNSIANAGHIQSQIENVVTDDVYVKVSGLDSWFYIGNKKEIDAIKLKSTDDRYAALRDQHISSQIDWPSDQYQPNPLKREIENILAEPQYVRARAQEAIEKAAEEGSPFIWEVKAEDPEQGIENMKKLWTQKQKPSEDFFKIYIENLVPFSLLAKSEGGIGKAISKLCNKQEGFIHINNGTTEVEHRQIQAANEVLNGHPVFIDSTSLLFLIDANLHTLLSENIEHLYYTPSVPAYIREHASSFAQNPFQMGHISFGKNMEVIHSNYDHQKELKIKNHLLDAVTHFEQHAQKETSDFLSSKKLDLESELPSCITDPLAAARAKKTNIISEDFFYSKALDILGGGDQPFPISSMALLKVLYERRKISWDKYLSYISYLLNNRCKLVRISPKIIQSSILVENENGLVTVHAENIRKLRLDLTLSTQYGVSTELAATIISGFLILLIQDNAITSHTFSEIVAELLIQVLKGKDKYFGDSILSKCNPDIQTSTLILPVTDRQNKFNILTSQIKTYFAEFNPLYDSIPLILARASQKNSFS